MPWVEPIFNEIGLVIFVKCYIVLKLKRRTRFFVAKWDSIEKHVGKRKAYGGKWFMDPKCGHAKDEIAYVQLSTTIVLQQLELG
jgi:hypothetical protein